MVARGVWTKAKRSVKIYILAGDYNMYILLRIYNKSSHWSHRVTAAAMHSSFSFRNFPHPPACFKSRNFLSFFLVRRGSLFPVPPSEPDVSFAPGGALFKRTGSAGVHFVNHLVHLQLWEGVVRSTRLDRGAV